MYMGCSGATYVYTCCIVEKVRICGKIISLALGFEKGDLKSAYGNGKMTLVQHCTGIGKSCYNREEVDENIIVQNFLISLLLRFDLNILALE
jgi:hypothetical protein